MEQIANHDFSPSPSVGLGVRGRAPSHPEEVDTLLGIRQGSADRIGSYIADLRADNITKTCELIVAHAMLVEIRGYCESLRQQLPAMSMRQIEASLNELVATLRKAVEA